MRINTTAFVLLAVAWLPLLAWSNPDNREVVHRSFSMLTPDGTAIVPRYSTIDDVKKALGDQSREEYFKQGGEDFHWKGFWIYYYGPDNLRVYFDSRTRRVIRITAYFVRLSGFKFPFGVERGLDLDKLLSDIKKAEGLISQHDRNWVAYGIADGENGTLSAIVFDQGRDSYVDILFEAPWTGYDSQ